MNWLRSPLLYGALLLLIGVAIGAVNSAPESGRSMTAADLRRVFEFQRSEQPIAKLDARYRPYAIAFLLTGTEAEVEAIKRRIDAEIEAAEAVRQRGLAGVPEYIADKVSAVDIIVMALGAALIFRGLAFVLALGFTVGGLHQLMVQSGSLTGAPSEYYLAAIVAALLWTALFWAARALYEGRLKFGV